MTSCTFDFTGARVLVTGSTVGIGRSIAEAFHAAGATVAINGRSQTSVDQAIDAMGGGGRLVRAPGDLSSGSGARLLATTVIEQLGGLDVLVNNAGRGEDRSFGEVDPEYWEQMIGLNLTGTLFATQACLPALLASRGSIVNVCSGLGLLGGVPGTSIYSTTKAALIQATRMLALEFSKSGVRVNGLVPGWIDTPMIRTANEVGGGNELLNYIQDVTPMGRAGTPEECAGAVLFLCSPLASFATGTLLVVDGGLTAGHYV
jgi:NAD(P)-dependent dehydrogenase (short-subunit alcohol dehydrogenase family)